MTIEKGGAIREVLGEELAVKRGKRGAVIGYERDIERKTRQYIELYLENRVKWGKNKGNI